MLGCLEVIEIAADHSMIVDNCVIAVPSATNPKLGNNHARNYWGMPSGNFSPNFSGVFITSNHEDLSAVISEKKQQSNATAAKIIIIGSIYFHVGVIYMSTAAHHPATISIDRDLACGVTKRFLRYSLY